MSVFHWRRLALVSLNVLLGCARACDGERPLGEPSPAPSIVERPHVTLAVDDAEEEAGELLARALGSVIPDGEVPADVAFVGEELRAIVSRHGAMYVHSGERYRRVLFDDDEERVDEVVPLGTGNHARLLTFAKRDCVLRTCVVDGSHTSCEGTPIDGANGQCPSIDQSFGSPQLEDGVALVLLRDVLEDTSAQLYLFRDGTFVRAVALPQLGHIGSATVTDAGALLLATEESIVSYDASLLRRDALLHSDFGHPRVETSSVPSVYLLPTQDGFVAESTGQRFSVSSGRWLDGHRSCRLVSNTEDTENYNCPGALVTTLSTSQSEFEVRWHPLTQRAGYAGRPISEGGSRRFGRKIFVWVGLSALAQTPKPTLGIRILDESGFTLASTTPGIYPSSGVWQPSEDERALRAELALQLPEEDRDILSLAAAWACPAGACDRQPEYLTCVVSSIPRSLASKTPFPRWTRDRVDSEEILNRCTYRSEAQRAIAEGIAAEAEELVLRGMSNE